MRPQEYYLKKKFEMKDLRIYIYCFYLQIKHCLNDILVHQSIYIEKVLKRFYIDKLHLPDSLLVVHSFEVNKDPFCPKRKKNEELFSLKVSYLSAISALMYLVNCTRPNIAFSIISQQDTVLPQLEDIEMKLNMYCYMFVRQVTQAYII